MRLYQKALTHGEIRQNYNATRSRIDAIPKIPAPKNAVLYVDASGPCRTRTYDSSTFFDLGPNEVDGTVQGASQQVPFESEQSSNFPLKVREAPFNGSRFPFNVSISRLRFTI